MDKLIGYMKKLQDNLGDFNDLSVQQQELMAYLNEVLPRSRRADRLLCSRGHWRADCGVCTASSALFGANLPARLPHFRAKKLFGCTAICLESESH